MAIELKVPEVGESITEVEIGDWLKHEGDEVQRDEPLATLESEKATVELSAPQTGKLTKLLKQKGEVAKVGEVIGYLEGGKQQSQAEEPSAEKKPKEQTTKSESKPVQPAPKTTAAPSRKDGLSMEPSPAEWGRSAPKEEEGDDEKSTVIIRKQAAPRETPKVESPSGEPGRQEEAVPMSRLRRTVAERLVEAQRNAALLTTFNEIDMSAVMELRKSYGEAFREKYKVKLGLMSFFVKASIEGLKEFPMVNAEIRGTDIVYHNYYDVGIAVGSGKGLVVPVLRNAERMSFAEIEKAIGDFGQRAKEGRLKVEELQGGTFTISNGGVYGSLLSTPIVNPPQSGVLGLHAIQQRAVVREEQIVIRSMMYIALTYDHRIVDGREGVSFLKRVKEVIENPARMLIEV